MNRIRQIRNVIYRLKRQFGLPVTFKQVTRNDSNLKTGETIREYTTLEIRRAIVVAAKHVRDFAYDLAYIAANKNFTYGAFFDQSQSVIILDIRDLPVTTTLTLNDHFIIDGQRNEIKEIIPVQKRTMYFVIVKEITSTR